MVPMVPLAKTEPGGSAILGGRMDSPTFNAGRSAPDPQAGDPAAKPAPEVIPGSDRPPAGVLARPVLRVPHRAPGAATGDAAAPSAPALGVDIETLVTEDDTPVDNMPSEKQQRLLTEPLYSSWAGPGGGRTFLAAANVGVFPEPRNPAIVPDVFVSLDVQVHQNWWDKAHRSYFVWEFGKPPDLVVEIVSNREGNEVGRKRQRYAGMGVGYYVIHDPLHQVMDDELRIYRLSDGSYERQESRWFPELRLGLMLWDGVFEAVRSRWLRWIDEHGMMIPTGRERADEDMPRNTGVPMRNTGVPMRNASAPMRNASAPMRSISAPNAWRHCCAGRASIRSRSDVNRQRRMSDLPWREPQGPEFVLEVTSRSTRGKDQGTSCIGGCPRR